jgi:hypothetical protein
MMTIQASLLKAVAIVMSARHPPVLAAIDGSAPKVMSMEDENFTEKPCPDWLGFYDWLRTGSGEFVGLRLFLDDPADLDFGLLTNLSGIVLDAQIGAKRRNVTVFFGQNRQFDERRSVSADFGGNRLFLGDNGSVAIAFCAPDDAQWHTALERYGATRRLSE